MRKTILLFFATGFLLIAGFEYLVCVSAADNSFPEGKKEMGIAAESYAHNRESFEYITCDFQVTDYKAKTTEDALKDQFTWKSDIVYDCRWVVRGREERHLLNCDAKSLERVKQQQQKVETQSGMVATPCFANNYLTNGDYKIDGGWAVAVYNIYKSGGAVQPIPGRFATPFNLGYMMPPYDPGESLRKCLDGKLFGRFDGFKKNLDRQTIMFSWGDSGKKIQQQYCFDPERGYLPIYNQLFDSETGQIALVSVIQEIRDCSKKRWFPVRAFTITPISDGREVYVREYKVTGLDVDNPPQEKDLQMILSAGSQLIDGNDSAASMGLRKDMTVSAKDLPQLYERLQAIGVSEREAARQRAVPKADRSYGWFLIAYIGITALLLLISWLRQRYKQRQSSEPTEN